MTDTFPKSGRVTEGYFCLFKFLFAKNQKYKYEIQMELKRTCRVIISHFIVDIPVLIFYSFFFSLWEKTKNNFL